MPTAGGAIGNGSTTRLGYWGVADVDSEIFKSGLLSIKEAQTWTTWTSAEKALAEIIA